MRPRTLLVVAMAAVMTLSLASAAIGRPLRYPTPVEDGLPDPRLPDITAATWILFDESSDAILAAARPDERRAMASTTKIMTALLAIEEGDLSAPVTVTQRAADTGEREIGVESGEQISLGALLKAALIHSGNDAAMAIAEHIGGSVEGFVEMMNQRAAEMGLRNTSFANPHGLDAPEHYSSARDLLELAREAMSHEEFRDIVRSRIVVFPQGPDGTERVGTATNLLLGEYEGASGIKTGFTFEALLTFVATAEREDRRLYAVVLGSEGERAHLEDAEALFDYGFDDLGMYSTVVTGEPYITQRQRRSPDPLLAAAAVESMIHIGAAGLMARPPESRADAPEPIAPPVDVVNRHPRPEPGTLEGALRFWFELISQR